MNKKMKDYSDFSAVDLVQDEDFVRWMENAEENAWGLWYKEHPEKIEDVEEAKRIIAAVENERPFFLHDSKQQLMWSAIEDKIVVEQIQQEKSTKILWYAIAASLAIFVSAVFMYDRLFTTHDFVADAIVGESKLLAYSNESSNPSTVVLHDGSVVTLQPHSTLNYPEKFSETRRDVFLTGEAFFQVNKQPKRPFSVYSSKIVTRVLGTSFTVRAFDSEKDVVVTVKTGKVSVLTKEEADQKINQSVDLEGTLLTPNQQITFSKGETSMVRSLVKDPLPVQQQAMKVSEFDFVDTPIKTVFERMEKEYGVEVIFDEEILSKCFLNASLEDASFHDKLRLICKGINASYKVVDGHVIITGNGC